MEAIASLNQGRLQRRRQIRPDPPLDQAGDCSNLYDDGQSSSSFVGSAMSKASVLAFSLVSPQIAAISPGA